jgi:hypothetical protein
MAFRIDGPYKVGLKTLSDKASAIEVRCVDKKKSLMNLRKLAVHARAGGLYVFAIRRQRGSGLPWYVGKNEGQEQGSLYKEALTNDKLRKYARALTEEGSGNALLFFLSPTDRRSDNIDDLEKFLIWLARQRNPRLLNKRKVRLTPQSLYDHLLRHKIAGVLNAGPGNPGAAGSFKKMIGWNRTMHVAEM